MPCIFAVVRNVEVVVMHSQFPLNEGPGSESDRQQASEEGGTLRLMPTPSIKRN